MGFLDAGYALFEFTGQKLLDFYDILSSAPAIVKIFQNNNTKKNRRKEKGLAGKILTPKRSITKSKLKNSRSRDAHIIVTPRTQKLSLAITPSIKLPTSTAATPVIPTTPLPSSSSSTASTPAPTPAPEKIQKLESELTKLREEIAKLMAQPKPTQTPTTAGGVSGTVSFPSQPVVPHSFVPPPPPPAPTPSLSASAPPPPPPPPPPAGECVTPKLARSASSFVPKPSTSTPKKEIPRTMSMADILKGASASNLRKTDLSRSPGGTPVDGAKGPQKTADPQDFIAQALKKKFASMNKFTTPDATQKRKAVEGDSGWDETPPPSPPRARKSLYAPIAFQDENVAPVQNVVKA